MFFRARPGPGRSVDRALPGLELVTHAAKTHINDRQRGAYRTKQKGPHSLRIPTRGHILQQTGAELDAGGPLGIGPRTTLPPPKVLSALFVFFFHSLSLSPSVFTVSALSTHPQPPTPLPSFLPSGLGGLIQSLAVASTVTCSLRKETQQCKKTGVNETLRTHNEKYHDSNS